MKLSDKKILVVDDTEFHRFLLVDLLENMGFHDILCAQDGLEAVRMARFYKPDLILLDLMMPNIDGYETCEKIRLFANMPIIVITGLDKQESLEQVFELGANDYFEKPFDAAEVSNRILFYLEYFDALKDFKILRDYIDGDMQIAKSLQNNIMSDADHEHEKLQTNSLDFYTHYEPFAGIGGDSWSVYKLASDDPVFFICDISGHGINAAINNTFSMSAAQSVFDLHSALDAEKFNPAFFMDNLNFVFAAHMQIGTFGAAACLSYNQERHEISYAGCAIPDIWVADLKTGEIERKACNGFPVGITPDEADPICGNFTLNEHQIVLVMSDGIIESPTTQQNKDIFTDGPETLPGEKMMQYALSELSEYKTKTEQDHLSTQACIEFIIERYQECGFDLTTDDVTLMAFQRSVKAA